MELLHVTAETAALLSDRGGQAVRCVHRLWNPTVNATRFQLSRRETLKLKKKCRKNTGPCELYVLLCGWIIDLLRCVCWDDWQKVVGTFFLDPVALPWKRNEISECTARALQLSASLFMTQCQQQAMKSPYLTTAASCCNNNNPSWTVTLVGKGPDCTLCLCTTVIPHNVHVFPCLHWAFSIIFILLGPSKEWRNAGHMQLTCYGEGLSLFLNDSMKYLNYVN